MPEGVEGKDRKGPEGVEGKDRKRGECLKE
jgi:hypothetical protein